LAELIKSLAVKAPHRLSCEIFHRINDLRISRHRLLKRGTKGFGRGRIPVRVNVDRSAVPFQNINRERQLIHVPLAQPIDVIITDRTHRPLIDVAPRNPVLTRPICLPNAAHRQTPTLSLSICCLNARSVRNKSQSIHELVCDKKLDALAITETWLKADACQAVNAITPAGYKCLHVPRPVREGGGVALVFKSNLCAKLYDAKAQVTQFEHMEVLVSHDCNIFLLAIVYRPPPTSVNGLRVADFFTEWNSYLEALALSNMRSLSPGISTSTWTLPQTVMLLC
jgi:hypothetical protein